MMSVPHGLTIYHVSTHPLGPPTRTGARYRPLKFCRRNMSHIWQHHVPHPVFKQSRVDRDGAQITRSLFVKNKA